MQTNYQLRGNPTAPVQVIGNLIYDELGQSLIRKHNEKFKSRQDTNRYFQNQTITHSNTLKNLSLNEFLLTDSEVLKLTNGKINLLSPEQVIQFWGDIIPEFKSTYADTNSVAVYPKAGPNEELRGLVLKLMGIESPKVPLIISNLGVAPSDSQYGFAFTRNDFTKVQEAPYLKRDQKVSLNRKGKLETSKEGVLVWTPNNQSGLCRLYRNGDDILNAGGGDLLGAYVDGRVQLISSP